MWFDPPVQKTHVNHLLDLELARIDRRQITSSKDNLSSREAQALPRLLARRPSRQSCICKRMVRSRPA
jgi:hypothetical protein